MSRRKGLRQTFEVAAAQTAGLVNFLLSRQTSFSECEPLFIDKPVVITEPHVASARLLGLDSKLYPSNMQRMLNKDLIGIMQSVSQSRTRKASAYRVHGDDEAVYCK